MREKGWQLEAWRRSPEFRAIAKAALIRINAMRRRGPRCGATRKRDGEPCRKPALLNGNGRCEVHGGRTPKGRAWHVQQLPRTDLKFARKLRDLERRRQKQAARVAAMTPEQRARYEAWHRSHKPGSGSARAIARADRDAAKLVSDLLSAPPRQPPGSEALEAKILELEVRHAILSGEGVFG